MSATILCLYARKGGSGRTLITQQLAGACAERGLKVLLVDHDPQGSLSKNTFGAQRVERLRPYETAAALYDEDSPDPSSVIHETSVENISLLPSSDHMEAFDLPKPEKQGTRQFALRDFLENVRDDYELILVDTPPNASNLPAWASIIASDFVMTPVRPDKNSCEAVLDVKNRLIQVMESANPELIDLGYFLTDFDTRLAVHHAAELSLRRLHGNQVFDTVLYSRVALKEAPYKHAPITHLQPESKEAHMVRELFGESIQRMQERYNTLSAKMAANE